MVLGEVFEASVLPILVADGGGLVVAENGAWRALSGAAGGTVRAGGGRRVGEDALVVCLGVQDLVVRFAADAGGPGQLVDDAHGAVGGQSHPRRFRVLLSRLGVGPDGRGGQAGHVAVTLQELTGDAAALAEMRARHHQLRAVVDHAPALIFLKSLDHKMLLANREMTRSFNLVENDLDDIHMTRQDAAAVHRWDDEIARCGTPVFFEEKLGTAQGERHFSTVKFPLRDAAGTVIGVGGVAQDITERVRVQEENIRLQISERAATEAALNKARFLATMSHEIRTPLSGIIGLTKILLEEGRLGAAERGHLAQIDQSSQVLLRVLNDVLDFSRLEANGLQLERAAFDLHSLVESICGAHAAAARGKNLVVEAELHGRQHAYLQGDGGRLAQVLNNLLSNAIKFSGDGAVVVAVDCEPAAEAGGAVLVRIAVRDRGIGLAAKDVAKLFSPFTQADGSISRRFGGTGLGLAICRGIVDAMGGRIEVDSEVGVGSTFTVLLTLPAAPPPPPPPARRDRAYLPDLRGRVLVAEDNAVNQTIVLHLLARMGLDAHLVADGEAACQAAGDGGFDLVLMDCHMPRVDGFEATGRIRRLADRGRSAVPIVALTANALSGEKERCLRAGMTAYLAKPVGFDQLYRCLARYLPPR